MKDTCSIGAYGPGGCEWNSDFFLMFLDIEQSTQFLRHSKLLKTEMICTKCGKTMQVCKAEDTVDKVVLTVWQEEGERNVHRTKIHQV